MHFGDRICEAVNRKDSRVVVGLDPRLDLLPSFMLPRDPNNPSEVSQVLLDFNLMVIDAVADIAVAVKPQLAFYEAYGSSGIACLEKTNRYAHAAGLAVICDAKRNDIGSTAEAYARAFLERSPEDGWGITCDALTVNPYLGNDGLLPFLRLACSTGKGFFVLVKTSNPSSPDLQDVPTESGPMYLEVARQVRTLAEGTHGEYGYSFVGAVVGATFREAGSVLRARLPGCLFLVPGFGAQGGTSEDVVSLYDQNGHGALISSSRGVTDSRQYLSRADAVSGIRERALEMRSRINAALAGR